MSTYRANRVEEIVSGASAKIESTPRLLIRRWLAAAMMLAAAVLAIFFVSNAIAVNELMENVTRLEAERNTAIRSNEGLRSEMTRLMSVDHIIERASSFGMVEPSGPPIVIEGE